MNSIKDKTEIYKLAKIWGLITFIPFVLALNPIAGYFVGDYLEKKIGFAPYVSIFFIVVGFIAGALEVIKIIKLIDRTNGKL